MIMYLTCDFTGLASGIQYGKAGDMVTVISVNGDMALVDGGKEKYHIRYEKLSQHPPDLLPESKPEEKPSRPMKFKRAKATTPKQKNLF